jgi:DNA modification methylase
MTTTQLTIFDETKARKNGRANKLDPQDRAFHDWYRFVLSYPPHLVRDYIKDFQLDGGTTILDPFCGTGTTLIESKLNGIASIGTEANTFAHFASSVKIDWDIDPDLLCDQSRQAAKEAREVLSKQGIDDDIPYEGDIDVLQLRQLSEEENKLILTGSVSPLPLHKTLVLLDCLKRFGNEESYRHQLLALAQTLVYTASNLRFGPEVGVGKPKQDISVISGWLSEIEKMAQDLRNISGKQYPSAQAQFADARRMNEILLPGSIDAVITSPPYPNEKDYTRITRLESVVLGFISTKADLRLLKKTLVRSNTRNVYKGDDDDLWIAKHPEIQRIADSIEKRRVELGKTSGFEKLYGKVTKLYFGGMARHLESLKPALKPNAQLAYVVGDQASYLRVMIRTGQLLGEIAQALGYEVVRIDLFRTRLATATKEQLREEVVILKYKGH